MTRAVLRFHAGVERVERPPHATPLARATKPPPAEEAELVRRLAAGDEDALTAISEWLWASLAAYAYRIVDDRDVAADIAQDALVRLWVRRRSTTSLRGFLFRITRNLALDHVKTRRTRNRLLRAHGFEGGDKPLAPDEVLERDALAEHVQRAIQALPERRREVFALAYLHAFSYAEIGEIMSISSKTVKNQMSAALSQLRSSLRPILDERRVGAAPEWSAHDAG